MSYIWLFWYRILVRRREGWIPEVRWIAEAGRTVYLSQQSLAQHVQWQTHEKREKHQVQPREQACLWLSWDELGNFDVGIAWPHIGAGIVISQARLIPENIMTRLRQEFDTWFHWPRFSLDSEEAYKSLKDTRREELQDRYDRLPKPDDPYLSILHDKTNGHPSIPFFKVLLDVFESGRELVDSDITAAFPPWLPEVVTHRLPLENEEDDLTIEEEKSTNQENNPAIEDDLTTKDLNPAIKVDRDNERREQANPHSRGFVYLIHEGDTTFYKIGMSLDPQVRLKTLQTANPRHLHLTKTQEVQDMRDAELSLHKQFTAHRVPNAIVREWFDFVGGTDEVKAAFDNIGQ